MKMKFLLIGLLTFCTFSSFGQDKLTLQMCRNRALESNKEKRISSLMSRKARYDKRTYWANFFPHIEGSANYIFNSKTYDKNIKGFSYPTFDLNGVPNGMIHIPNIPLNLSLNKNWTAGVTIKQPLYTGGKIRAAYNMAKIGLDISSVNEVLTSTEVIYQTDLAYWSLLKAEELLLAASKYEETVNNLLLDVNNAFEVGMKSKNDVLKVKVKLNEAKLNTRRVLNGIKLAKMNLCHVIGLPLLSDVIIDKGSLDSEKEGVERKDNIQGRPEYLLLTKKIALSKQQVKLARSENLPELGVIAGWNYYDGLRLNNESLMKGGSFSALFSVRVPIFKWGEGVNKVRAMKTQQKIVELERENVTEKMELEMTMALNQVDESFLEVQMTEEALASATENLKTSKEHFDVGLDTLSEYLEAQTLWQKAWTNHIEAKASLKLNETKYMKAAGLLTVEIN